MVSHFLSHFHILSKERTDRHRRTDRSLVFFLCVRECVRERETIFPTFIFFISLRQGHHILLVFISSFYLSLRCFPWSLSLSLFDPKDERQRSKRKKGPTKERKTTKREKEEIKIKYGGPCGKYFVIYVFSYLWVGHEEK